MKHLASRNKVLYATRLFCPAVARQVQSHDRADVNATNQKLLKAEAVESGGADASNDSLGGDEIT